MKLIVGLGNPDLKYYFTRHNIGFQLIDFLLNDLSDLKLNNTKFNGVFTKTKINDEDVIIAKPLTYMNMSGEFIKPLSDFYKIEPQDILICYDEVALDMGRFKITKTGSSAGHNGIKSIIAHLGTENFMKLRIGMGPKPDYINLVDYVLQKMSKEDAEKINLVYKTCIECIKFLMQHSIDETMNMFNKK
ncbi:MAG: aminoacyl-tRNA hydrolase [Eubacteriales bacterium]|nr:aminoacyl-tRNA hydrolase [Eubacteriales bacterium]